jgi:hypothetical protein
MKDDTILALVTRLARPHSAGGAVIERAAILAEGADLASVMAWIEDHNGHPEPSARVVAIRALHESRISSTGPGQPRPPRRYVLPAGILN